MLAQSYPNINCAMFVFTVALTHGSLVVIGDSWSPLHTFGAQLNTKVKRAVACPA